MSRRTRLLALAATALLSVAPLAACSSGADTSPDGSWSAVVDVRTPEEFASGHVAGAVNLDVQDASFADEIAALDTSGTYLVYCRSGNRAATAVDLMEDAGLTATNGGGLQDMVDDGWALGD